MQRALVVVQVAEGYLFAHLIEQRPLAGVQAHPRPADHGDQVGHPLGGSFGHLLARVGHADLHGGTVTGLH